MVTYTRSTKRRQSNFLLVRSSNNIYDNAKEIDDEVEVEVLRNLHHKHIIKVEEIVYDDKDGRLCIIMEQGKTNIAELMDDKKKIAARFDEETIRMYMKQLVSAVGYMHDHGYFHRDLKPENMVLVDNKNTRLIDFGTCMRIDKIKTKEKFNDYVSTRWYRAPE
jgi:renal tumor antigen